MQRREGAEREIHGIGNERVGRRAGSFRAQMRALAPSLPVLAMIKEILSVHSIANSKNKYISIIIGILTFQSLLRCVNTVGETRYWHKNNIYFSREKHSIVSLLQYPIWPP